MRHFLLNADKVNEWRSRHGLLVETSEVGLIKRDYSPRKSVVIDSKNNAFVLVRHFLPLEERDTASDYCSY